MFLIGMNYKNDHIVNLIFQLIWKWNTIFHAQGFAIYILYYLPTDVNYIDAISLEQQH